MDKEFWIKHKMKIAIVAIAAVLMGWGAIFNKAEANQEAVINKTMVKAMYYTMSNIFDYWNFDSDVYGDVFYGPPEELVAKLDDNSMEPVDYLDLYHDLYHFGGRDYGQSTEIVAYVDSLTSFMTFMENLEENPNAHTPYEFWNGQTTMEYYLGNTFAWLDGEEEWKSDVFFNVARIHGLANYIDPDAVQEE